MTAIAVNSPFEIFSDTQGNLLESGYIYIGQQNKDPQTFPISVYEDEALTIPVAQPIRTVSGYPVRSTAQGTPIRLYVDSDYSITVKDRNETLVYTVRDAVNSISADYVNWLSTHTGAVTRTVSSKLFEIVSVTDFGASTTVSAATNQTAFEAALSASSSVSIPEGVFDLTGEYFVHGNGKRLYGAGVSATVLNITGGGRGLILGNSGSSSTTNHNMVIENFSIVGGTYGLQVGSSNSPLTYLGQISNIKITGSSSAGVHLYQGIAELNRVNAEACNRGMVTLSPANGGGASTLCQFNSCRFYQNTLEGWYSEQGWGLVFNACDFESNGRDGILFQKVDGVTLNEVSLNSCWFENNHTDGTYTTNRGSITAVAGSVTKMTLLNLTNCYFNGVTGYGTGNIHVYGSFNSVNFTNNFYVNPSVGAINMTHSNVTGVAIGVNENFTNAGKITRINSTASVLSGDLTLSTGNLVLTTGNLTLTAGNLETTDGTAEFYNSSASDGEVFGGFFINTSQSGIAAKRINCGPDVDRVSIMLGVAGTINARYWTKNDGDLMFKNADPANASDGTVVGTQTFSATHIYKHGDTDLKIGEAVVLKDRKLYRSTKPKDASCCGVYAGKSRSMKTSFDEKTVSTFITEDMFKEYKNKNHCDDEKCIEHFGGNIGDTVIKDADKPGAVVSLGDTRYIHNMTEILGVLTDCDVEPGDLICTSETAGLFTKQDDDIIHSYTIGKIMEKGSKGSQVYAYILL